MIAEWRHASSAHLQEQNVGVGQLTAAYLAQQNVKMHFITQQ